METKEKRTAIELANEILELIGLKAENLNDPYNMCVYDLSNENNLMEKCGILKRNKDCSLFDYEKCGKFFDFYNGSSFDKGELISFKNQNLALALNKYDNTVVISLSPIKNNQDKLFGVHEIQIKIQVPENDTFTRFYNRLESESHDTTHETNSVIDLFISPKISFRFFSIKDDMLYVFFFETKLNECSGEISVEVKKFKLKTETTSYIFTEVIEKKYEFSDQCIMNISHESLETIVKCYFRSNELSYPQGYENEYTFSINLKDRNTELYRDKIYGFLKHHVDFYCAPNVKEKIDFLLPFIEFFIQKIFEIPKELLLEKDIKNTSFRIDRLNSYLEILKHENNEIIKKIKNLSNELKEIPYHLELLKKLRDDLLHEETNTKHL